MTQVFNPCLSLFSVFPFRHPFARIIDWSEDIAIFCLLSRLVIMIFMCFDSSTRSEGSMDSSFPIEKYLLLPLLILSEGCFYWSLAASTMHRSQSPVPLPPAPC
jgi:hypothetical protein